MIKRKIHILVDGHLIVVGEASVDSRGIKEVHISNLPKSGTLDLIIELKDSMRGPCLVNIGSIEIDRQPNPLGIENHLQVAV